MIQDQSRVSEKPKVVNLCHRHRDRITERESKAQDKVSRELARKRSAFGS